MHLNFFPSVLVSYWCFSWRQWQPTPVLLPGKSRGWRSLVGCSPWGCEESDTTERLHFHFSLSFIGEGNGNPLVDALRNSHKLSSLKQCKFFLQLWSPKIHSQSHWAKVKISRTGSFCALREIPFSCLFQVVEPTFLCSWSSSIQQLYHSILYVHYYVSLFVITFHL